MLLACRYRPRSVAKRVGVCRQTIYRWRSRGDFGTAEQHGSVSAMVATGVVEEGSGSQTTMTAEPFAYRRAAMIGLS